MNEQTLMRCWTKKFYNLSYEYEGTLDQYLQFRYEWYLKAKKYQLARKKRLVNLGIKESYYNKIHKWAKENVPYLDGNIPHLCSICNEISSYIHICCIGHGYTKDINTWIRLCPSCHLVMDNLLKKISTTF